MSRFVHTNAGKWSYVTDTATDEVVADDVLPGQARVIAEKLEQADAEWDACVSFAGRHVRREVDVIRRSWT